MFRWLFGKKPEPAFCPRHPRIKLVRVEVTPDGKPLASLRVAQYCRICGVRDDER